MKKIWGFWKKIAEKIGQIQAMIIFSILYFLLITPIGLISKLFNDSLKLKKFPTWEKYELNSDTIQKLKLQ